MRKPALALILSTLAMLVAPAYAEANCPVINGTFEMPVRREGDTIIFSQMKIATRQAREQFSYTVDLEGNFQLADGKKRPIRVGNREGTIRFECVGGSLLQEMQANGSDKVWWYKFRLLNDSELEVTGNYPGKSGTYIKTI